MGPGALRQLNLTQVQRDELRALREQQQKDGQALRERMRTARAKMREAMRADIPDEAAVKAAASALAAVQADRFAAQARNRAQTMKLLTPEQQAQLKDIRRRTMRMAERRMMFGQRRMMRGLMMRQRMMRRMQPMPGEPQPMRPGAVRRWII